MSKKQIERRGRPRGTGKKAMVPESTCTPEPLEPLSPDDFKALQMSLQLLRSLRLLSEKFERLLKDPAVHKRFKGNVHLLMGLHELSIYKLAELSGCSQSTMSRMLDLRLKNFEKTRPLTFVGIAEALGASVYTLLCVDLREKLLKSVSEVKPSE